MTQGAAPKRIVEMSVAMQPTGAFKTMIEGAKQKILAQPAIVSNAPKVGSGIIELRVALAPKDMRMPAGYYVWAVVETYGNGHQEILIGSGKPTITEAAVEGAQALESVLITVGKG